MAINEDIRMMLDEEAIVFDNPSFDNAIIAVDQDGRAVYDYDLMVEELMRDEEWTMEDAIEWIEYNTLRSIPYAGDMAPIVVYRLEV
jgi:hypothetical protein